MRSQTLTPADPLTGRLLGPVRTVRSGVDSDPVPAGDVSDVLAWVGYDPDRAKAATVAEHSRDHPRNGLLTELAGRTG